MRGRQWYESLGSPSRVLAPMVDQSEHAYRVLCRRHGVDLAYTPMFSSRQFAESDLYRRTIFGPSEGSPGAEDAPLIVQFAGNDPDVLLAAAKHVEGRCNAVDINFGCPQKIAKRGHYGSWLLDDPALMQRLVGTLHCHLECPVTAKIRVLPNISETVDMARMLQDAGASIITVHGRTRDQKGALQGSADWSAIATVKAAVSVPVFANGGISCPGDIQSCLDATAADGIMAGEGLLDNPALFEAAEHLAQQAPSEQYMPDSGASCTCIERGARQVALSREYIAIQEEYPADLRAVKQHLFTLLYAFLQVHVDLRERMHKARTLDEMTAIVDECGARPPEQRAPFNTHPGKSFTSWYRRHTWEAERKAMKAQATAAAAAAAAVSSSLPIA